MQYNHLGLYTPRKRKSKLSSGQKEKSVDWINVFLFILLFAVVILFIVT